MVANAVSDLPPNPGRSLTAKRLKEMKARKRGCGVGGGEGKREDRREEGRGADGDERGRSE